ncbi:50S ribosomal protein L25 [Paenibacillus sp. PsM32]|uniref:50S ribosomal protein L25 n=1 Tax=Paenibacillus sp. PsM32 TaxID=3030536 RepID=UPI00263BD14C|nr:50S ribosomal protein L25 [Paenibacillus sp. PsM32]MDN4616796.1 50S ribosomal protein L25 [Paenibacillus sp. PsM32]
MSTSHEKLTATKRESSKRSEMRELRLKGRVPGVVYGPDLGSVPVHVDSKQLLAHVKRGGAEMFSLAVEGGKEVQVLIKDVQRVDGRILHADFMQVSDTKPIHVTMPIDFHGEAIGTKSGGVLQHQATELEVSGLAKNLPSSLEVDISALEIGDRVTAGDVKLPSGVTLVSSEEEIIASVIVPRVAEEDLEPTTAEEAETTDASTNDEGEEVPEVGKE